MTFDPIDPSDEPAGQPTQGGLRQIVPLAALAAALLVFVLLLFLAF